MKPSPATDWHSICKVSPGPGETARVAALVDGVKVKDGTTRLASGFAVLLQPGDTFVYHAPTRMEWMYQVDDQHVTRSYSGGRPVSKRLCCHGSAEHDIPTRSVPDCSQCAPHPPHRTPMVPPRADPAPPVLLAPHTHTPFAPPPPLPPAGRPPVSATVTPGAPRGRARSLSSSARASAYPRCTPVLHTHAETASARSRVGAVRCAPTAKPLATC